MIPRDPQWLPAATVGLILVALALSTAGYELAASAALALSVPPLAVYWRRLRRQRREAAEA